MLKKINLYTGLPRTIYLFFIFRTVTALGSFVTPYLALYLSGPLNLRSDIIGIIISMISVSTIIGTFLGGRLTDRFPRKWVLIYGKAIAAISYFIVPLATGAYVKIGLIFLSSIASAIANPAMDAIISDLTTAEQKKSAFSLMYLGINLGSSFSPMIAGILFTYRQNLIFWGQAIVVLSSVALLLKASYPDPTYLCSKGEAKKQPVFFQLISNRSISLFYIGVVFISICEAQLNFSLPLYTENVWGTDEGPVIYGMLMMVNGLTAIALTPFISKLTDKNEASFNLIISSIMYLCGFGMYSLLLGRAWFILATCIWSVGEILLSINLKPYVLSRSNPENHGEVLSYLYIVERAGTYVSPVMMGFYLRFMGIWSVWVFLSIFLLGAGIIFTALYLHNKKEARSTS